MSDLRPLSRLAGLAVATVCLWTVAAPAWADWLVLQGGERLETRGPWQQRGKIVVFSRADGTLASLRVTEVDLEASRKATEESLHPKPVVQVEDLPDEGPKKKRTVITDKDLPRRSVPPPATPAVASDTTPAPASPVTVGSWRKQVMPGGEGTVILGALQNSSASTATNLTLQVTLTDDKGALLATAPGLFPTRMLAPKGSVEFRATFPGITEFAAIKFDAGGWVPEAPKPEEGTTAPAQAPPLAAAPPSSPPPGPSQR